MKKLFFGIFTVISFSMNAQVQTPALSPVSKFEQKVGLTDITIQYSRPGKRDRLVFGDVVPFGEIWRLGANENTKITSSDAIIFGKDTVKAGTYAIYAKPEKDNWTLFLYSETTNWGVPEPWDTKKVVYETTLPVVQLNDVVETLTISIEKIENNGASLVIMWDKSKIALPFTVNTKDKVLASIKKTMEGPSANDYNRSATFYYQEKIDVKKALEWSTKACEMRPEAYWMLRTKALLQAENGDFKGAIATAKKSIELAEKDGDAAYVKMNKTSIEEWSKKK
jgi:tetratricopeptide (TPR) repeat protein